MEGYPSSGNSFAYNVLKILFPNLRIAHHCHSLANVKLALTNDVPTVTLLRDPFESISSRIVRFYNADSDQYLDRAVEEYAWFYGGIREMLDAGRNSTTSRVHLLPFRTLVQNPTCLAEFVTEHVFAESATRSPEEIEFASELARKCIKEWTLRNAAGSDVSRTVSLPTEERTRLKEAVKHRLAVVDPMERAVVLHGSLRDRCSNAVLGTTS